MSVSLAEYLASFIRDERLAKMQAVLAQRTRRISVVLEDIFQPHNASAVLRSCDALGVQDLHIVENNNRYKPNNSIALGSAQWLSLRRYQGPGGLADACRHLKGRGFRLVATTPRQSACSLESLSLAAGPIALLFGTELSGLSPAALSLVDESVFIPMYGFVESFNVSVTVALCLYSLTTRLRTSSIDWRLSAAEQAEVWLDWLRVSQKRSAALEARWFAHHGPAAGV